MLRTMFVFAMSLLLAGCWMSDQRFFDTGDWAKLSLSGEYEVTSITDSDGPRRAALVSRLDGLVEIATKSGGDDEAEPMLFGFVPITGGSGGLFLAVDRTTADEGDIYYLASLSDDGDVGFYFPVCEATPAIDGLVVENTSTCKFTTEEALMKAALEAEHFMASPHIVAITPFMAFSKVEPASED